METPAPSVASGKVLALKDGTVLHWEHGLRCHGLWTADNRRIGVVGIGPRGHWRPDQGYSWQIDHPRQEGTAPTLRVAKAVVERLARAVELPPAGAWS